MFKGYKYRIYPNKTQEQSINQMFGNARWVYNWALARRIKAYQKDKTSISAFTLMKELAKMKKKPEYEWLNLSVAQSLQQSIRNMDKAFKRFFREKHGFPRFKLKHDNQSIMFPQNTKIDFDANRVWVLKLGWIPARLSRTFDGTIKTAVISKTKTGKFFISITVDEPKNQPNKKPIQEHGAVGIDTGSKTYATLSDGTRIENPKYLVRSLKRLRMLQRRVSKKVKGSKNRAKAIMRLARQHEKIANQRLDFLHKRTTEIANRYDTVFCENLNIKGMMANRKLTRSIGDLGLGYFYQMLKYKLEERGKNYDEIGRFEPSSKLCTCGVINNKLTLADREWTCESCGRTHDRDFLAANNILRFGLQKHNVKAVGTTV
jgi:putative transposase